MGEDEKQPEPTPPTPVRPNVEKVFKRLAESEGKNDSQGDANGRSILRG